MNESKLNKSASRTLDILILLSQQPRPLTISEISRELGVPKSSTFDILHTMVERGFLEVNPQMKTYQLGLRLFEVGAAYLYNTDLHQEARPFLEALMSKTGETAFLAVESDGEIVYMDKVEGPSSVRTTATLGTRYPMYVTGLGKAILAAYSDEKVIEIMKDKTFERRTANSAASLEELLKRIHEIRRQGYAVDDEENEKHIFCIACPVYNSFAVPVGAISIAGLKTRMAPDKVKLYAQSVAEAAQQISRRLGYRHPRLFM